MMRNDAWLAGFADGEGSFNISPSYKGSLVPRFKVALRVDDLEILEALQDEFGGFVSVYNRRDGNSAVQWVVSGKRDLAGLVEYFDRFPLRAKKARDYRLWRRAVVAYCAHGGRAPELPALRVALMGGRLFEAAAVAEPRCESDRQLALVAGGG